MKIKDLKENKRYKHNIIMFTISFLMLNLISGIVYDSYINYLQEVAPSIATSFWSYYGYGTFISAILLLLVNRFGYKKILLLCPLLSTVSMGMILFVDLEYVYGLMTLFLLISIQLHHVILSPFMASYTRPDNRTYWYSVSYWSGYLGWAITTYLGGLFTVVSFSLRSNNSFSMAKELTKHLSDLSPSLKSLYLTSNKDILLVTFIVSLLSFIPVLFIREEKKDYSFLHREGQAFNLKNYFTRSINMLNKYSLAFIAYLSIVNFAMGLFSPYFTIYLNRYLFIDRSTASLLVAISYLATVIFLMFTTKLSHKFGQIKTLATSVTLSIPFMILIANGKLFGSYMIGLVGISLFFRSGLANLGGPIESSLPMEIVKEDERTYMGSLTYIISGIMSILAGKFTGSFLFNFENGYKYGYYLASILYLIGVGILLVFFMKKYNYTKKDEPK